MIFIAVKFSVRPEVAEQWLSRVAPFTSATREEPGNVFFEWSRSVEKPNQFVLLEARSPFDIVSYQHRVASPDRRHVGADDFDIFVGESADHSRTLAPVADDCGDHTGCASRHLENRQLDLPIAGSQRHLEAVF